MSGTVLRVPCTPVVNLESPCAGRPMPGLEIDFTSSSGTVVVVTTDSAGYYTAHLPAGTWKVRMKYLMRILSGPATVTVTKGASVAANYLVDIGIRVPQPVSGSPVAN